MAAGGQRWFRGAASPHPCADPAVAGMPCPQPSDCLSWPRAASAVMSQCRWGHGPAEGEGLQGCLLGEGGCGEALSCGSWPAAFPGPSPLGCLFEAGDGVGLSAVQEGRWIRELPPGLPPSGKVSADPCPISPFQVSFTFESP